jgi:hypothetical protein
VQSAAFVGNVRRRVLKLWAQQPTIGSARRASLTCYCVRDLSTVAKHACGLARSSDEVPVMGMERGGRIARDFV